MATYLIMDSLKYHYYQRYEDVWIVLKPLEANYNDQYLIIECDDCFIRGQQYKHYEL